ncbi:hypothetical protein ABVT39_004620 [Epinephelus coioides]
MKLSVLLLLVLPALSSAGPLDIRDNTEQRNVSFKNSRLNGGAEISTKRPLLTVATSRQTKQAQSPSFGSDYGSTLEWVTWNNSLPNNSVSIYNDYTDRIDYVCKYKCEAGFYTPSKGPYCHYANTKKALSGFPFEILVNKNMFEVLEWKRDSYGSVPQSAVRTCPGEDIYVGMNEYGLGKVDTRHKVFYLPWKDDEYRYHDYQVLTTDENIISQLIYDVRYSTDELEIFHYPPEIMQKSAISNYECHSVLKTDTLSKTYETKHRWDFTFSIQVGVTVTFDVSIPFIASEGIQFSSAVTFQYSRGNTVVNTITDTVSVEITAPPNHSCMVNMVQYKYRVQIPFTAQLRRTYANGEIRTISITGLYDGVHTGEVRTAVDRCEPLENSKPCS